MRHGMRKPRGLKLRRYADSLVDINEYLSDFPISKAKKIEQHAKWMDQASVCAGF